MTTEQKHTPGYWRYLDGMVFTEIYDEDIGGEAKRLILKADISNMPDLHRIVACVNACEGVDNETLEKIASGEMTGSELWELPRVKTDRDTLAARVKELEVQRDGLLDALKSIGEYWNGSRTDMAMHDACEYAVYTAYEAIAKFEAEKAP